MYFLLEFFFAGFDQLTSCFAGAFEQGIGLAHEHLAWGCGAGDFAQDVSLLIGTGSGRTVARADDALN